MPSTRRHRGVVRTMGALGVATAALGGCVREAEPWVCPDLLDGDLVLTELRGAQSGGNDTYGQWIELYNRSGQALDLRGVQVHISRLDGSGYEALIVRAPELLVEPGDYIVLGHHDPARRPEFVDYSFFGDFFSRSTEGNLQARSLYESGIVEVLSCGERIDRIVYRGLPPLGTYAFDGALEPDHKENDNEAAWCVDDDDTPPEGPQTDIGIRGTPGEANRPCP
jgi:hypothetical protein